MAVKRKGVVARTQNGEIYYITNPGEGINTVQPNCNGCPTNFTPVRNYDGLELRVTKRMPHNFTMRAFGARRCSSRAAATG